MSVARMYGKVLVSAWVDKDFVQLTRRAQGTYFFLISQAELNHVGVLPMTLNRWAARSADGTRETVLEDLRELARANFIVVDEQEEQLLVRAYVRNDEGWKSPNIMKAISAAAQAVGSATLRAVLREEIQKIDTSGLPDKTVNDKTGRTTRGAVEHTVQEVLSGLSQCEKDPDITGWGQETLPERVPQNEATEPFPKGFPEGFAEGSLTETTTTTPTQPETTNTPRAFTEPDGFQDFWDVYPRRQDKGHARTAWIKAVRKANVREILDGAQQFRDDPNIPDRRFIPHAATWLNGERWTDAPLPSQSSGPSKPTTMSRLEATLALANEFEAETPQIGA